MEGRPDVEAGSAPVSSVSVPATGAAAAPTTPVKPGQRGSSCCGRSGDDGEGGAWPWRRRVMVGGLCLVSLALLVAVAFALKEAAGLAGGSTSGSASGSAAPVPGQTNTTVSDVPHNRTGPLSVGIADILEPVYREQELGAQFQVVVKFGPIKTMRYPFLVKSYLHQGYQVVLVIEFFDDKLETNLKEIGDGLYDKHLYEFADELIADGNREVWVRPLHEFNGDYPWGTYLGGTNTVENFVRAYRHVHEVLTAKGARIKFQLAYNCDNAQNDKKTPFTTWWPGADVVDMVVCSAYNRDGTGPDFTTWQTWEQVFQRGYEQMDALPGGKPLGVGEMGSTWVQGYDKAAWITDAFETFKIDGTYPRIEQVTWFLQDKGDGEWDLNAEVEINAFSAQLKGLTQQGLPRHQGKVPALPDLNGDGIINTLDAPATYTAAGAISSNGDANSGSNGRR